MDHSLSRSMRALSLLIEQPASERPEYWEVLFPGLQAFVLAMLLRLASEFPFYFRLCQDEITSRGCR